MSMEAVEKFIRGLYQAAEGTGNADDFSSRFTEDGTFTDESAGVTYRGPTELRKSIQIYGSAFPDMHRELYNVYVAGDVVVVELSLNGTWKGPLALPSGTIPANGKRFKAPCCDVFKLKNGKVQVFDCYPCWSG
jgi:predicted ester cyclase